MKSIRAVIARRTKKFRVEKGLTQKDLAKAAGLHWTFLAKIESSKKSASIETICKLAAALQIETHELLIEERPGGPGQRGKREELIKILKAAGPKELGIYTILIKTIHKSKS